MLDILRPATFYPVGFTSPPGSSVLVNLGPFQPDRYLFNSFLIYLVTELNVDPQCTFQIALGTTNDPRSFDSLALTKYFVRPNTTILRGTLDSRPNTIIIPVNYIMRSRDEYVLLQIEEAQNSNAFHGFIIPLITEL